MSRLDIKTESGSYPLMIEPGCIKNCGSLIRERIDAKKLFLVADENVFALYGEKVKQSLSGAGFDVAEHIQPPGEKTKSMRHLELLLRHMAQSGMTRSDAVVALGGGVTGDISGFAAAVYMRGIPYIGIPTTLLAQIDSSIGGKTAVDLKEGKNLVGAFYQPKLVVSDPETLATLGSREFKDGMAEMIKYACIADAIMFRELAEGEMQPEKHIQKCCEIKKYTVEEDEKDTGIRMILNFGHTVGHAVEACANFRYTHGQAVAAGMAHITKKSEEMGLTQAGTAEALVRILKKYGLPYALPRGDKERILSVLLRDKKLISGKLNLILLKRIGECYIYPVQTDNLHQFI